MDYLELLKEYQDDKYLEFHKKLVTSKYPFIGIRVPNIKKVAKEIIKSDGIDSIGNFKDRTYEEILCKGFVIAELKTDYKTKIKLIDNYVKLIDNWALCDSFVSALKNINLNTYFSEVKKYLKTKDEYKLRFGLVMLLDKYIDAKHADYIYKVLTELKTDKYYYLMAKAWLLSYMFVYDFQRTCDFILEETIDDFTYNKGITKAIDSFRITDKQKEILKELRGKRK